MGPLRPEFRTFYDTYPLLEETFQHALDESLHPRGPEVLYDVVRGLGLPPGGRIVDLGCGEGGHSVRLARETECAVIGIDPVRRHIDVAERAVEAEGAPTRERVRFVLGVAEAPPLRDATADAIVCREMLYHVEDLEAAFAQCRRVLRHEGLLVVYQAFAGERLEPREADWLWSWLGTTPENTDRRRVEAAFARAGFRIERRLELTSESAEYAEEERGEPGRRLLHAARLLRAPERYIERFGREAYEIMLRDCFWHVFRMTGKLEMHLYVLALESDGARRRAR